MSDTKLNTNNINEPIGIGKAYSFITKALGVLWIIGAGLYCIFTGASLNTETAFFVVIIGMTLMGSGLPVDISKIITNIKGSIK